MRVPAAGNKRRWTLRASNGQEAPPRVYSESGVSLVPRDDFPALIVGAEARLRWFWRPAGDLGEPMKMLAVLFALSWEPWGFSLDKRR